MVKKKCLAKPKNCRTRNSRGVKKDNLKRKNRKRNATDTVVNERAHQKTEKAAVPLHEQKIKRRCIRDVGKLHSLCIGDVQKVEIWEQEALESMYHDVFKRFHLSDDVLSTQDEIPRRHLHVQPHYYGDGVNPETFKVIATSIHDMILATKRSGVVSLEAERYLATVLGICTFDQRKKLVDVEKNKFKPIALACKVNNLNVVRFLVDHCCADVNGETGIGRPLFWAIINGNEDMVHYLLECGADVGVHVGENFNFLMLAMQIFPQKSSGTLGYGEEETNDTGLTENQICLDSVKISISLPKEPKTEIVDMLLRKGAVEKCSDDQLFDCITICMEGKKDKHITFLSKLLNSISDLNNLRNSKGCSLLGHEISTNYYFVSNFLTKLLENGADVNDTRILKYVSVPPCKEQVPKYRMEVNVDSVLKHCVNSIQKEKLNYKDEDNTESKFVHSIVYLASSMKITLLSKFLLFIQIPFQDKFDALQLIGAYYSNQQYFGCAAECWKFADKLKQQKCVRVTRKKIYHENDKNQFDHLDWDVDNISVLVAQNLPPPPLFPFHITKFMTETARGIINRVSDQYENCIRQGSVVELDVQSPQSSFKQHIKIKPDDLVINDAADITHFKIITKSAMIFERLVGYGSYETVSSFDALASEYEKQGLVRELVELISYSYPYFVKYLPQNEKKRIYLKAFVRDLAAVLINEALHSSLTFDHLMVIWKCFFLDCFVTSRSQRGFFEFSLLLLAMKVIYKWEKTEDETRRFRVFLREVVRADLRNFYGQTLLHYTVPTIENVTIDHYSDVERSQVKDEISGSLDLIKLLLAFGADPNAADDHGMTSLHFCYYLMSDFNCKDNVELAKNVVQTLIEAGAHPDCVDTNSQTPIDNSKFKSHVPLCPVQYRSLQCLASCVIIKNNIQYKGHLTDHLTEFVELHRKRGKPLKLNFPSHIFG